jgi:site-specific recombinase XerD
MGEYYKSSVGTGTFRNYRRGLADYARLLQSMNFPIESITNSSSAIKITAKALHQAVEAKWNGGKIRNMKTAVIKLYSTVFDNNFSGNMLIRNIVQSQVIKYPPKKEHLSLHWKLEDLLVFLRAKPSPERCSLRELTELSIVHLMIFKGLRFAEIHRLSPYETSPDVDGWKFWVVVKNHHIKESVIIFPSPDRCLDTLAMLMELKRRITMRLGNESVKDNTFWYNDNGKELFRMSYDNVRGAASLVLEEAGIKEHHPYHIKHATLTFLSEQGVPAAEITAFARHKYGSMAVNAFYRSWDQGKALSIKIVKAASRNTESLSICQSWVVFFPTRYSNML